MPEVWTERRVCGLGRKEGVSEERKGLKGERGV